MFLSKYNFKGTWREYQAKVLDELNVHFKDRKVNIVAAPWSGKTILGLEIVRRLDENVLILTPTITIKNQRVHRFTDMFLPEGENVDWISKDIYNLSRFNVVTYQALHYALNKKFIKEDEMDLEEEEEEEETEKKIKTDSIDYDLIKELKNKKIKTIVLDEAHHLRAQWWKSLKYTLDNLEDIAVVSLTATPPYDVEENEWKRYEEVCGTIDAEISTPELVATGDLCPHQDYLMFSYVTEAERYEINKIKKGVQDFMVNLKRNEKFIDMLKNNEIINNWQTKENEEIILSNIWYYWSIIIFLNSVGVEIDRKFVKFLTNQFLIPRFEKERAEILLKNVLFDNKKDYESYNDVLDDIKYQLNKIGCIEKSNIFLRDIKKVRNLLAGSAAKIESIGQIARAEYKSMWDELRLVILADYIRQEYLNNSFDTAHKLGVIPIFKHLLSQKICDNIAVMTGKLKIIPKTLIPRLEDKLNNLQLSSKNIFKKLDIDDRFVVIKASKKVESIVVRLVTESMEDKKINIMIWSVALLWEWWDAPCVNSLILSSFVGSFMLSNQMRGRAIRANKNMPNKTANIWHLASFSEIPNNVSSEKIYDYSDYYALERRFKSFVGIWNNEYVIQNGISRLGMNDIVDIAKDIYTANNYFIKLSEQRDLVAQRRKTILEKFGGTDIKMVNEVWTKNKIKSNIFVTMDVSQLLRNIILINIYTILVLAKTGSLSVLQFVIVSAASILMAIYYLIKIIRHTNPRKMMQEIWNAVLHTMIRTKKIKTNPLFVSTNTNKIKIDDVHSRTKINLDSLYENVGVDNVKGTACYTTSLQGASVYENNLYTQCIKEIYSKVLDNRYLICVWKKNFLSGKTYFNVPSIFDNDKKTATIFAEEWNKRVIKGTLMYTRNAEGRKILLRSRRNSLDNTSTFFDTMSASNYKLKNRRK